MADSLISSLTEETQDRLDKALLEGSILFALNRNKSFSAGRDAMFLQCVFAIVSSKDQKWTDALVQDIFHERFGKNYNLDIIKDATRKLLKEGWLAREDDGFVTNKNIADKIKADSERKKKLTDELIGFIISSVETRLQAKLTSAECQHMEQNIKDTFNLYIRIFGFESFVNNAVASGTGVVEDDDIVNTAMNGLPEDKAEMLVNVLSDLLENPSREQAGTLMMLVKIYLGTQIMRLDPQLNALEKDNLKGKKFVLDTDFILYCLVTHPKQSKGYRTLLRVLRNAGCHLIIPEAVAIEVQRHAQCAEFYYQRSFKLLKSIDRDIIEQRVNNVFVKDYCLHDLHAERHQTIKQYMMNNYLSDENPLEFTKNLIRDRLHIEPENGDDLEVHQDYLIYQEDLTQKILERTRNADTDKVRKEEEMCALSETDAKLYLSVLSLNKDVRNDNTGEMLKAKAYLVTGTTKSIKSAYELGIRRNFVTRPELLINLMAEIGEFDDSKKEFINLFENPFLAHIIESNWEMIRNLTEAGLSLHDKSITVLKNDLGKVYHKYLTKDADVEVIDTTTHFDVVRIRQSKDFFEFAQEANRLNYKMIPEVQGMIDAYKQEINMRMSAEEKQRIAEKLLARKVKGYRVYIDKTDNGKRRENLGYKKQKR